MKKLMRKMRKSQIGATMVEYGLMLALIAVVCIAAVTIVGIQTNTTFMTVGNALTSQNT